MKDPQPAQWEQPDWAEGLQFINSTPLLQSLLYDLNLLPECCTDQLSWFRMTTLVAHFKAHSLKSSEELEAYSDMLRELCSFLSVGGYNSDGLMPPDVANAKIRDGIDNFIKVERERAAASAQAEILSLHAKLAGETLRADQGWERYEARNKSALALEKQLEAADDGYNEIGWIASGDHGHPKYVHFKDAEPEVGTSIFVASKAKLSKGNV